MTTGRSPDYGWVLDEEQETLDLITELLHGTVEVIDPVFAVEAGNRSTTNDIGSTYIEIDLDNQRMVYYEAGKPVIDTGIISGFPHDEATVTPTGTYILRTKVSPGTIVDNWDTQDVYFLLGFGEDRHLGCHMEARVRRRCVLLGGNRRQYRSAARRDGQIIPGGL